MTRPYVSPKPYPGPTARGAGAPAAQFDARGADHRRSGLSGDRRERVGACRAPAGTPDPILRRLNAEFTKAAKQPDVHQSITATGGFYPGYSLEEVAAFVRAEHARWKKVVSETGIKAN